MNLDTTLAVGDHLLFTTALEEVPASVDTNHMNQLLRRLEGYLEGARLRAVVEQLKKAAKLYKFDRIKQKVLYK